MQLRKPLARLRRGQIQAASNRLDTALQCHSPKQALEALQTLELLQAPLDPGTRRDAMRLAAKSGKAGIGIVVLASAICWATLALTAPWAFLGLFILLVAAASAYALIERARRFFGAEELGPEADAAGADPEGLL